MLARRIAFLVGCMGSRFGLTYLAATASPRVLPWMGAAALVVAAGFATIHVMGWRRTGLEVGGERIWWDALRPVHAALWALFAVLALASAPRAWTVLLVDTLLGLAAYIARHATHATTADA